MEGLEVEPTDGAGAGWVSPSLGLGWGSSQDSIAEESWPRFISISFAWPFILPCIPSHPRSPFLPWRKGPGLGPPPSAPHTAPLQREGQWCREEVEEGVWLASQAGGNHCVWGPECLHSKCLGC